MKRLYSKASEHLGSTDVVAQWRSGSDLLAVAGWKRQVTIYDRAGTALASINLPDPDIDYDSRLNSVVALEWHSSGEYLAVLPRGQHFAMIWNATTHEVARVDAHVKGQEACFLMWQPTDAQLMLGSAKGAAVVYNCGSKSILRLQAKLGKAICSGAWVDVGNRSYLVLGAKDQHVVWFDPKDGTAERIVLLKGIPAEIRAFRHTDGRQVFISAAVGTRSLLVWELPLALMPDPPPPEELTFQDRYGDLEAHLWLDGGMLLAGFRSGQVAVVATDAARASHGTEVFSSRLLPYGITSINYCQATQQVALAGGSAVGLLQWDGQRAREVESDWAELDGGQQAAQVQWSPDGHLLTVTTKGGKLHQYLVKAPSLRAVDGTRVAYTTSLTDVTIIDLKAQRLPATVRLRKQPDMIALGPGDLAAITRTKVAYHSLTPDEDSLLPPPNVIEYPVEIHSCHLNNSHAVLLGQGGEVYVQSLTDNGGLVELRSEDGDSYSATCIALTKRYIIVGLGDGTLVYYDSSSLTPYSDYHHSGGSINAVYPDAEGTKLIMQDSAGGVYLYNAITDDVIEPPSFAGKLVAALWHVDNPNLLVLAAESGAILSYVYINSSVAGHGLKFLSEQTRPQGAEPLVLHGAFLTCRLPAGSHEDLPLAAFEAMEKPTNPQLRDADARGVWVHPCQQALSICHLSAALAAAERSGSAALLAEVAATALHLLDVPMAVRAYEAAGDEEAAAELRPLCGLEDRNLLEGRVIAVLGGDIDRAQQLLLSSSRPLAALELRKELGHWQEAQQLALELDPAQEGPIAMAKAQALEAEGLFGEAATAYEAALALDLVASNPDLSLVCEAGLAHCSIQAGDFTTGVQLALDINDPGLSAQCAEWLAAAQQHKAAGDLYAAAGQFDSAAEQYLSCREFGLVDGIIGSTSTPAVLLRYAEVKEDLGSFAESAAAYLRAGQRLQAVRVFLQRLGDVQAAIQAADGNTEGRLQIAKHCAARQDYKLAVEQYCLAGCWDQGMSLAKQSGAVQALCAQVRLSSNEEQARRLSVDFERQGDLAQAAEFGAIGKEYERAARLYLKAGGDSVKQAIALAANAKDSKVVAVVVQHLQATEGMAEKLMELHMLVGQPEQACEVAVARARVEQSNGNYKAARDQLLKACTALQERRQQASPQLLQALALLHSYLLVKTLVRMGDHLGAARMLLRVADSISSFPKHVVPILTSTVIECHRAGLLASAHKWACLLMQPQHAPLVAEPYRKKIEGIANLPGWNAEESHAVDCECLFCGKFGPETELSCSGCKAAIPFCIATGMRLSLTDASECPNCHFPCRGTALAAAVGKERLCPMCDQEVPIHTIRKIFDPISHLKRTVFARTLSGGQ